MLDILKYVCSIIKDGIEKFCKDWVDYMLYGGSYDFKKEGSRGFGDGGGRIRVIGTVVTRY